MTETQNMIDRSLALPRTDSVDVDYASVIMGADTERERIALTSTWILHEFDSYYFESRRIPELAKKAFENRDPITSLDLSKKRLSMYSELIHTLGPKVKKTLPVLAENEHLWQLVEEHCLSLIQGRYEADFAFAFIHSVRRKIYQGEWKPVEYSFSDSLEHETDNYSNVCRRFDGGARVSHEAIAEILELPNFTEPYRALSEDAFLIAERINNDLGLDGSEPDHVQSIEMIDAGFYRNRGAYQVGRIILKGGNIVPLIIAILNGERGIYVDAVLVSEADAHNLFSSTLANFHVTHDHYHELAAFLYSIMPQRPLGLHYSTIGYNHVGKVAIMNELKKEMKTNREVLETAVGFRGTVTIGFAAPSSSYNLKVIRDEPTAQYKWGTFEGLDAVLEKYGKVHEINRTGSMLDNVMYYNLKLERELFEPSLLKELMEAAGQSVFLEGDNVIFKHLIVQLRITPVLVYLETASSEDAETVIINLGYSIKNNMAANIFNKDLDARNYGVSRFLRVFLFDYDALEQLTAVKIRTNTNRIDGEEDIPDWYFEDGVVMLPEEIESGLRIPDRSLRRLFREVHGDLLTTEYWESIQTDLRNGKVPRLHVYPEDRKLDRASLSA